MRYFILSSLLALLVSSCDLQKLLVSEAISPAPSYKNPHTVCGSCHSTEKPKRGGPLFAEGTDPSASCIECHDYQENHHPVDFIPPVDFAVPFPLFDGKIKCLTCHEIHGGPGNNGIRKLLRGGPYEDRRQICFRCHSQEKYARINPHQMLDDGNRVREVNGKPVCLICHLIMPDPETDISTDVRFRADVGFLCWRCHPPMPDPFFSTHFLVRPSPDTLKVMNETEEKRLVVLPLVPRGRITCATCHNPHQAGVIQHERASKGADSRHRLRLSSICLACHRY